jgi:hypothetical protein
MIKRAFRPLVQRKGSFSSTRRQMLKGVLGAGVALQLPLVQAMTRSTVKPVSPAFSPRRAVYQDMPYMDYSGHGQAYIAPVGNRATREYLASLDDEQRYFLPYFN